MTSTRDRLLDAARELLDAGGPPAVTLRDVGARAGVSRTTPYRHFTDKRDLLACLAAAELRTLASQLEAIDRSGGDALVEAGTAYIAWARAYPARFHLTFGPWHGAHAELAEAAAAAARSLGALTERAHRDGLAPDYEPAEIATLLWSVAHGSAHLELSGHADKEAAAPSGERIVAMVTALLRPER